MTNRRPGWWLYAFGGLIATFLMLPTIIVVPLSFSSGQFLEFPPPGLSTQWYSHFFEDPEWTDAAVMSAQVGLATAVLATVLGTAAALGMHRARLRGRGLLDAMFLGPMLVPVVVIAIGAFATFSDWGLTGTFEGLVLSHTMLAFPFALVTVGAGVRSLDPTLERAACTLGANQLQAFTRITLPLLMPNMLVAALFCFIVSWDEVVVSIFMTSPTTRTLPVVMFSQLRTNLDPTIAAVATMLTVLTISLLIAAAVLNARTKARRG